MYNYVYTYEAKFEVFAKDLVLGNSYLLMAGILTALFAIAAFALVLFTAIAIKRARPYGIFVALLQPLGFVAANNVVIAFSKMDFSALNIHLTGFTTQQQATDALFEAIQEAFMKEILPQMVTQLIWSMIFGVVLLFTIVYFALLIKAKAKALPIISMIATILTFFLVSPVNTLGLSLADNELLKPLDDIARTLTFGDTVELLQLGWYVIFGLIVLAPLALIALQGIINIIANAKAKKAAAAVVEEAVAEEAVAEEAVAEEAVVEEAVVEEAVVEEAVVEEAVVEEATDKTNE